MTATCPTCGSGGFGVLDIRGTTTTASGRVYKKYTCRKCDTKFNISYRVQNSEAFYRKLIKTGTYITAIKSRRTVTGEGLREAKTYIDAIKDQMIKNGELAQYSNDGNKVLSDRELVIVKDELRQGSKVGAIRLYKRFSGASLLDAKTAVDNLESEIVRPRAR